MKRKNINAWRGMAIVVGVGTHMHCAMAAPTVAQCKTVYSDINCAEYRLDTASNSDGSALYICMCINCAKDYALDSGATRGNNRDANGYHFYNPNACGYRPNSSSGGVSSACTSAGGSACTVCQGPNYTINGVMYCGMYSDGVKTCSGPGGAQSAYQMSNCCKDNKAYQVSGCFVMACKTGMVVSPAKTSCICQVGYYGNWQSCTQCPALNGFHGLTSGTGASAITDCFIPAGVSLTDGTGTYKFTSDCKYQ
ncbi:MAG: hypothetical protein NC311_03525 [Muribaculaceae bacterium]|nr:hypothetical protein [Muribaculaceae bacterium]